MVIFFRRGLFYLTFFTTVALGNNPVTADPTALDQALTNYRAEGAKEFSAERGKELWYQDHKSKKGDTRDCTTCHGRNLGLAGKHKKTGKKIEPMAPSVNPERFTDLKKIRKWFRRNCKWAWGRACTAQEKGDLLTFLTNQ